jgi:RND family efflux transporter MFP subunit
VRIRHLLVGLLIVASVVTAYLLRTKAASPATTSDAQNIVTVTRRDIATKVKATGVIRPMVGAEVRVGSRVSGVVRRLYVHVGDAVRKGQLLAELDDRELVARHAEAASALDVTQANLQFARSERHRRRDLHAEGLVTTANLEAAERECAVAEKQYAQGQATLAYAETQLSYARVVAPISGVVSSVATQEGETVAASFSAPTFVTLLDLGRLEVRAYVDETDIGRIRVGQAALFTVDTYGDREVLGRVARVYPQAEIRDNVVNYITVVNFTSPPDLVLRPEMTTAVRIALDERQLVLALPLRAVRREGGRSFVVCQVGSETVRKWVTTGARDDAYTELVTGLSEGERVVVGDTTIRQKG